MKPVALLGHLQCTDSCNNSDMLWEHKHCPRACVDGGEDEVTAPGKLLQSAGCLSLTRSALGVAWGGAAPPPLLLAQILAWAWQIKVAWTVGHGGTGLLPKSHHPGVRDRRPAGWTKAGRERELMRFLVSSFPRT